MNTLEKKNLLKAFKRLDELTTDSFEMIVGGGAAMICAYGSPLHTGDVDAVLKHTTMDQIKKPVRQVAKELDLPADWVNSWYSSFTHNLPQDFSKRLKLIFKGKKIKIYVLGPEDLLIMKCCAHRAKDVGHARLLLKRGADYQFVMNHLEDLNKKQILLNEKPIEFLEDLLDRENL